MTSWRKLLQSNCTLPPSAGLVVDKELEGAQRTNSVRAGPPKATRNVGRTSRK